VCRGAASKRGVGIPSRIVRLLLIRGVRAVEVMLVAEGPCIRLDVWEWVVGVRRVLIVVTGVAASARVGVAVEGVGAIVGALVWQGWDPSAGIGVVLILRHGSHLLLEVVLLLLIGSKHHGGDFRMVVVVVAPSERGFLLVVVLVLEGLLVKERMGSSAVVGGGRVGRVVVWEVVRLQRTGRTCIVCKVG